ncbi:MAG: hypothetical protein HUU01_07130 [Saprospiraceae bacterium]|nr:hypothetical protein [Saprospiraceae bacterium]
MKFNNLNLSGLDQSEDTRSFNSKLFQRALDPLLKSNTPFKRFYKTDIKSGKYQLIAIEHQGTTDGQTWLPQSRVQYTYKKKLLIKSLYQEYRPNTSEWIHSFQLMYVYQAVNLLKKTTSQFWDDEKKVWVNQHEILYDYDTQERIKAATHLLWNDNPDGWKNSYKEVYQYGNSGLLLELDKFSFRDETWIPDSRHIYRYGSNNNLKSETIQQRQAGSTRWVNFFRHCYLYNLNNQKTKEVFQTWNYESSRWLNNTQTIHIYAQKTGELVGLRFQQWNKETEGWSNETQYLYTYYSEKLLKKFLIQSWLDETNSWLDAHRSRYIYDTGGRILEEYFENKFDEWAIEYAEFYTYDKNGNLQLVLTRHKGERVETLLDAHKTLYFYKLIH